MLYIFDSLVTLYVFDSLKLIHRLVFGIAVKSSPIILIVTINIIGLWKLTNRRNSFYLFFIRKSDACNYHGLFSLCVLVKYITSHPSTAGFPSLHNMEGVLQTYFPWGATGVFLSGTFCCLSPQPAASTEATPLLHQLLPRPPPSRDPPHRGRGQLSHTGYRKPVSHLSFINVYLSSWTLY